MSTFRKFIRNFAARTVNIRKLLKRDPGSTGKEPIQWTEECRSEMKDIVDTLIKGPMVGHPDFAPDASPFIVTVDTSRNGMGCTLSQVQTIPSNEDPKKKIKQEVILYFGSRKLTVGESRYSAYKLELTGLTSAVEHFRFYLLGKPFVVRTDCKSLEWLRKTTNRKTPAMVFRWQEILSEYDFTIQYIPGAQLKLVDSLSRRPYKPGESGNVIPLLPKRDKMWDDDCPIAIARECSDDETWIPVMTKRFGEKDSNNNLDVVATCCLDPSTLWSSSIPPRTTWNICALEPNETQKPSKAPKRIKFIPLSDNATIPKRKKGAATYDIFASQGIIIRAGSNAIVPTDLEVTIPLKMYGTIVTPPQPTFRGLAMHEILANTAVIDSNVRTKLHIVLFNGGVVDYVVHPKEKIAGLLLNDFLDVEDISLDGEEISEPSTSVQGNRPLSRGGDCTEEKWWNREFKLLTTPHDPYRSYPRTDIRRYMKTSNDQGNPMVSGQDGDDIDSDIEIIDKPIRDEPKENKDTSRTDQTVKEEIPDQSKNVCATELNEDEAKISEEINQLQEERFKELNHDIDSPTLSQKLFDEADDNDTRVLKTLKPGDPGNFWKWIKKKQLRDEACMLLIAAMYTYQRDQKFGEDDRRRHANQFYGKEHYQINEMRRVHADKTIQWDDSDERIHKQLQIFQTLKKFFIRGQIPVSTPLRIVTASGPVQLPPKGPVIMPLDSQIKIVQAVHHGPGTFHLGVNRTLEVLKRYAYFPNMINVVSHYIRFCDQCQRGKRLPVRTSPGLGRTTSLKHKPLQCWSIDVIFMPKGTNGMKFILTLVDAATSWVEAYPMRANNSRTVADIITNQVVPRYGEGLVFISDQGKEQTAKIVLEAIHQAGGQHYPTTSYHSKSNPVERTNLTIGQLLRVKLIDSGWPKEKWPKCLPEALYTIRMSPDTQTKDAPFMRVYGRRPYTRIDKWLGTTNEDYTMSPWHPGEDEEYEEEDSLLEENDTEVKLQRKIANRGEQEVTYRKIPSQDGTMTHLTVASLQRVDQPIVITSTNDKRQQAQDRRNRGAIKRHLENAQQLYKKFPHWYSPVEGELVDWQAAVDPDCTTNRKMRQTWLGPYRVVSKPDHHFTCHITRIDPDTINRVDNKVGKVAVDSLRPSTMFRRKQRPYGEEYSPEWWVVSDHNYPATPTPLDEQETDDDSEEGQLPRLRKRETKDALGKRKNTTKKR